MKTKFPTSKRFGIEGCDTAILCLKSLVDSAGDYDMNQLVFGMAHRGRLNTLGLVFQKSLAEIFAEIKETKSHLTTFDEKTWGGSGDVKYHLGVTSDITTDNGKKLRLSILPNPSHLETVNGLVYGKTRAIQDLESDHTREKNMGIVIHGDAAHAG